MEDKPQSKFWIVLIVAIISMACITCVVIIVFGTPFANKLADRYFEPDEANDLVLSFDGTFDGADGEMGYGYGLSFVPGHKGKAILFDDEDTLYYASDNNINPQQGVIEFWIKPEWNGITFASWSGVQKSSTMLPVMLVVGWPMSGTKSE